MTPYETALRYYESHVSVEQFHNDIDAIGSNPSGYLYKTPELFVIAKPTSSGLPREKLEDPGYHTPEGEGDTWFIHMFAGDFSDLHAFCPYPLPHVAWGRLRRDVTFLAWDTVVDQLKRRGKLSHRSLFQLERIERLKNNGQR